MNKAISPQVCWDTFGMCTSGLCAIHCAALPLLFAFLPALSAGWMHGPLVHSVLVFAVMSFCLLGIVPRYLQHRRNIVLTGMLLGLTLVLFATFFSDRLLGESYEVPIISIGNLLLIATHWFNRRLARCQSNCCSSN